MDWLWLVVQLLCLLMANHDPAASLQEDSSCEKRRNRWPACKYQEGWGGRFRGQRCWRTGKGRYRCQRCAIQTWETQQKNAYTALLPWAVPFIYSIEHWFLWHMKPAKDPVRSERTRLEGSQCDMDLLTRSFISIWMFSLTVLQWDYVFISYDDHGNYFIEQRFSGNLKWETKDSVYGKRDGHLSGLCITSAAGKHLFKQTKGYKTGTVHNISMCQRQDMFKADQGGQNMSAQDIELECVLQQIFLQFNKPYYIIFSSEFHIWCLECVTPRPTAWFRLVTGDSNQEPQLASPWACIYWRPGNAPSLLAVKLTCWYPWNCCVFL